VQFTREKIPDAGFCFVKIKVDTIRTSCAEFRRAREVVRPRMMSTSQRCRASTCFCSRQTKRIPGKAKAIWMKKLKMVMVIHKKQQL
jgi:hypothetical protein